MASRTIYLIRHGEKPDKKKGDDGKMHDQPGLSGRGIDRSKSLVDVFGSSSKYNIKFVLAQAHHHEKGERPFLTVQPLVKSLGKTIKTNFEIDSEDYASVYNAVTQFKHPGNILICWEHGNLTGIANALGVKGNPEYPDERFDLIWTVQDSNLIDVTSEQCVHKGDHLDAGYAGETWKEEGDGDWVSSMGFNLQGTSVAKKPTE